jgi:hypothetical protein
MGVKAGDMELVKAPLDFFGMNYYQRTIIAAAEPDKNRPGVELSDSGGLPLLEFAGQFRMGGRVHAAVWAGVCRFPEPEKDYQGIGGVVWEVGGDRKSEVKKEAKKQ